MIPATAMAPRPTGKRFGRVWLLSLLPLAFAGASLPGVAGAQVEPIPVFAYYYIWFDPGSWDRAKSDFPLLGRYSSDDPEVMRQHIRWAKEVGIDGFIVSWKSTEPLNRRLATLAGLAAEEGFELSIIYQGLDFERRPLTVDRVATDLQTFVQEYGSHPAFGRFGMPVVIWSGTWEFSVEEVAEVASRVGEGLLLLASERQLEEYVRLASWVDGNAYYWSSADPVETPGYEEKLAELGEAVHRTGGLWIAPAAPGFDARLVGGGRVIERRDGETLRLQMEAALGSSPDAIGLISWNEFSENTHVEPSQNFAGRSLEVMAELRGGQLPVLPAFDSDEPAETVGRLDPLRLAPLVFVTVLFVGGLGVLLWRGVRRKGGASSTDPPGEAPGGE